MNGVLHHKDTVSNLSNETSETSEIFLLKDVRSDTDSTTAISLYTLRDSHPIVLRHGAVRRSRPDHIVTVSIETPDTTRSDLGAVALIQKWAISFLDSPVYVQKPDTTRSDSGGVALVQKCCKSLLEGYGWP